MIREDNSYLSLAVPLGEYAPSKAALERFNKLIKPLGFDLVNADSAVAAKRAQWPPCASEWFGGE